ncbi:MAG: methyltransferase domain-containing protein [Nocardioides sp.]
MDAYPRTVIHQDPLAYLIGIEGIALLKAFAGEYDRDFTRARLDDVRRLLDAAGALGDAVDLEPLTAAAGYDGWAPHYDSPDNGIFVLEEAAIRPILAALPVGDVVDAACGTGRHIGFLAELGHRVRGYDISEGMLAAARDKLPGVSLELADVRSLPVAEASADIVVCSLALAHVRDLGTVFAEVSRVLRPGGRFVVCDTRGHYLGATHYPLVEWDPEGNLGYIPGWRHSTVDYLQAALAHGFAVRSVDEPLRGEDVADVAAPVPDAVEDPDLPPNIWELHAWAPEAANAAKRDDPVLIVWDFELVAR